MDLLAIFTWFDKSWLGELIRDSTWAFAAIEVVHLLGLTVLLGTITVVNLRLAGLGLRQQTASDVAHDAMPWTYFGMAVTMLSGFMLFVSEALKCYASTPFYWKMSLLVVSLSLTLGIQRRMANGSAPELSPASGKMLASVTVALWFSVGLAGRAIAFY